MAVIIQNSGYSDEVGTVVDLNKERSRINDVSESCRDPHFDCLSCHSAVSLEGHLARSGVNGYQVACVGRVVCVEKAC